MANFDPGRPQPEVTYIGILDVCVATREINGKFITPVGKEDPLDIQAGASQFRAISQHVFIFTIESGINH